MGKVLLIIGAVAGGLVFAFGLLGLIVVLAQPDANQSDEVLGAIFFMVVGLTVGAPCTFFAFRLGARRAPPWIPPDSSAMPNPAADLTQRYLAWFAWAQQAVGGDAVSLHAAAMAALASANTESATAAASAEAVRQSTRIATQGAIPDRPNAAKVRMLARIGASTAGLLEPSERVIVSFFGENQGTQMWGVAFGVIGRTVAASRMGAVFVTVTDRRVIALIGGQYAGLANRIGLIEPRATVTARFRKGTFGFGAFSLKGMGGGSVSMRVPRAWRPEALMAIDRLAPSVGAVDARGLPVAR